MGENKPEPLFKPLAADDVEQEPTEIESLCMNCYKKGVTRLLLTKIPFYKEIVLFSFSCEECGYQNNEIQSGGAFAEKGIRFKLSVEKEEDLNRKVVKSDYTSVKIIELDFEIPAQTQKGEVTTVEGIIDRSIRGLEQDQAARRIAHPDAAKEIDDFILKLQGLKELSSPFTLIIEDISGNSHVENPTGPLKDVRCSIENFVRKEEQNHILGIFTKKEIGSENDGILQPINEEEFTYEKLEKDEVLQFPTNCTSCNSPCQTNMKLTNVPYFKEVILMATSCDACGHRTNEVKSGGGIEPEGLHIEVKVNGATDFTRDVLKSETCSLNIPELDLELGPATLGGRFTTVEGLLTAIRDQLSDQTQAFIDSEDPTTKERMELFLEKLSSVLDGKKNVTIILDDPTGNSYVQSMAENEKPDSGLTITHYKRTFEQNEELGLNDIKTENYS